MHCLGWWVRALGQVRVWAWLSLEILTDLQHIWLANVMHYGLMTKVIMTNSSSYMLCYCICPRGLAKFASFNFLILTTILQNNMEDVYMMFKWATATLDERYITKSIFFIPKPAKWALFPTQKMSAEEFLFTYLDSCNSYTSIQNFLLSLVPLHFTTCPDLNVTHYNF